MEKLVPNPFLKNKNWAYLWVNSLKFYTVYLYCIPSWGLSSYIETKLQTIWFYFLYSSFKKQKKGLELAYLLNMINSNENKVENEILDHIDTA